MKHLTIITIIVALSAAVTSSRAQVVDPAKVAQDDAARKANNNIESGVDNGVGKAEGAIKGLFGKKKKQAPPPAAAPQPTTQSVPQAAPQTTGPGFSAYNNYDFIPGDKIIFADDFTSDQLGEFPSHWNLGKGQAVVNQLAGMNAFMLTDGNYAHVSPLIKSPSYLTDPFTIEFDSYTTGGYGPNLFFYNSTGDATSAEHDEIKLNICAGNIWEGVEVSNHAGNLNLSGKYPESLVGAHYRDRWHHVAIAYKNNQLKVYVDQYRILVVPNLGFAPKAFDIEGIGDAEKPIIIANVRVASGGGMNMLGKKFTEAKIITHGINFDIDKATIKPESMGTLNMIVGILKDNPDLKFEVGGHTDNTGTPDHNQTLSQQRAEAVKNQLISMGVDTARLSTKGYGDSKPISDNVTMEGKANNRRVEFVKM